MLDPRYGEGANQSGEGTQDRDDDERRGGKVERGLCEQDGGRGNGGKAWQASPIFEVVSEMQ